MERKIKVAYILTPITFGGSEKVSLNFLQTVDRDRFDVRLLMLVRPWDEEPYFVREMHRYGFPCIKVAVAHKDGCDPLRVLRVMATIYSYLKKTSFDLIHTHGYFADICGLPVAKILGMSSVATCHGFISNDSKLRVYNALDRLVLRLCQRIIVVSEGLRCDLVNGGIKKSRVTVIPNAVVSSFRKNELFDYRFKAKRRLSITSIDHVIGYVGRLSEEKGVKYLVEAASILRNKAISIKLIIVGDGPERDGLEQLVRTRGLERSVVFAGFQENTKDWFPVFDVFVLPSLTEGTPMALLEAMAMAVPVVATAVGGVPKVVKHGVNGLLVEPADSNAISDKIRILMDNVELAKEVSKKGVSTIIEKYDIINWCRLVEQVYEVAKNPE